MADDKNQNQAADAKAAADAKQEPLPEWLADEDYTGPLTCEQAASRIEHHRLHGRRNIADLKAYDTKPAEAPKDVKGSK